MNPESSPHVVHRLIRVAGLLTRCSAIACFAFVLWVEWNRWPNGSALLGPLGFVWYYGPEVCTLIVCVVSALAVLAFPLKPNAATAGISILGAMAWVTMGVLAQGIGC